MVMPRKNSVQKRIQKKITSYIAYGVIFFMKKQLQREWHMLCSNSSHICLWGVLTAFGGILLWVHGSAAPWVFRACLLPPAAPGFTLCFLLWTVGYAVSGCELGIQLLPVYFRSRKGLLESLLCLFAYLLTLAWYPLFFSVLHVFLSVLLLAGAILLHGCLGIRAFLGTRLLTLPYFISCLLEIYFLCVTISFMLLN